MATIKKDVEQVKQIMLQNIEKAMERQGRVDELQRKTSDMQESSFAFKEGATDLKNKLWWKNLKLWFILIGCCLVRALSRAAGVCFLQLR